MGHTHTLLTPSIIAKEALMQLENNLVMGNLVHRRYKKEFVKVGGSISIRKPNKFLVTKSRVRSTSVISEKSITLEVATQAHVSWSFSSVDLTLTVDDYSERYIKPAAAALANQVDYDLCNLYSEVYNQVEETTSWNADPASFLCLGKAGQRLDEESVPQEQRVLVLNPSAHWAMANALRTLYVTDVAKAAVVKGYLAKVANMEIYMDQNVNVHTTGHYHDTGSNPALVHQTAAMTSKTTNDTVTICDMKIVDAEVLEIGDIFTIAGVYAVNTMSKDSTGSLREFVVTATADATQTATDSGANIPVSVYPPLIHTGPDKNVDTLPAGAAAVTVIGNEEEPYPQNLAFHKNAFALVMVPIELPDGAGFAARESHNGLSIRVVKQYDIDADVDVIRLDILYGVKCLYPELACRIYGKEG